MIHPDTTTLKAAAVSKYCYEPEKFKVLNNISFEVKQSEFVTLVGKSGSGKSTLLYLLLTMDTEYEGEIFLDNDNLTVQKKRQVSSNKK
jgi:lipoprotein-releasing system ATP-binding protein